MIRKIIKIDEDKCDGCGNCVPSCAEGAIQIIEGKARLISDLFCDGLGACLGHCPTGAITIEEREAEPYNEFKVMDYIVKGGPSVIKAHLKHLKEHNEITYLNQAFDYLRQFGMEQYIGEFNKPETKSHNSGCPGSATIKIDLPLKDAEEESGSRKSYLYQWPIQLHLVNPMAEYYEGSDLLLAADCCGFAYPDFHKDFLKGKSIAIACPKLDDNQDVYLQKLTTMINSSEVRSITVMIMQVPCCSGLLRMAQQAIEDSGRNIPLRVVVLGVSGEILKDINVN